MAGAASAAQPWKITFDGRRLLLKMHAAGDVLSQAISTILREESAAGARRIQENRLSGPRSTFGNRTPEGAPLGTRTAQLKRSIGFKVQIQRGRGVAELGTLKRTNALVYAAAHEFGATIRPVRKKWLAIPLPASLTPTGVQRWTPMEAKTGAGGKFDGTFVTEGFGGSLLIVGKLAGARHKADVGSIVALFVLKKSVKIPKRSFLAPEMAMWSGSIEQRLGVALAHVLDINNALAKGGGMTGGGGGG